MMTLCSFLPPQIVKLVENGGAMRLIIAVGLVVCGLYLVPFPAGVHGWFLGIFGLFVSFWLVCGLIRWRPAPLGGWLFLLISQLMFASGDITREFIHVGILAAVPFADTFFYVCGYIAFIIAMPWIYWHFRRLIRRETLPEGLIIGLGIALVLWLVVVSPTLAGITTGTSILDEVLYPIVLLVLLFIGAMFLLTPIGQVLSFRLLFLVLAGFQANTFIYNNVVQGKGIVFELAAHSAFPELAKNWLLALPDISSALALMFMGLAFVHPSFKQLRDLSPTTPGRSIRQWNLVALALGFGLAPMIWLAQSFSTLALNTIVVILGMMVVFGLAEWRLLQLFQRVDAQNQELRTLDKLKSQFLANMTHELRTPLNSIINFSHFMQTGMYGNVNAEQQEAMARVSDSGKHLLAMINDVLDLAKIQADSVKLFVERDVSVRDELGIAVGVAQGLIADKPVTLVQTIPDNLPLIVGDRRRVRQVFINLMSNACKFTEKGQVSVQAEQQDGHILVTVQDTGAGIADEDKPVIFEPFRQAHAGLEQGSGSGLGLPIARSFVQAHYGKLWFESELNKGTTFYVELPICAPELERVAQT